MYSEDLTRIPTDEPDMWNLFRQQYEFVHHVLAELPVETKEDALDNAYHLEAGGKFLRSGMTVIRYRDTSNDLDQRDYFLEMGRELLPYIQRALNERKLTPEFVQQWGKVMFCHGYIASYVFDDTDDLLPERNRKRSADMTDRTPQRIFLARLILWFMDEKKERRKQAEASTAKAISSFLSAQNAQGLPQKYDVAWFQTLLSERDPTIIPTTMSQRKIGEEGLRELAATLVEDLPGIELVLEAQ